MAYLNLSIQGPMAEDITYTCDSSVILNDVVYLDSNVIKKAKADNIATMPAIGFITAKPSATTCKVRNQNILTYANLNIDKPYFVSNTDDGMITDIVPTTGILQQIGFSKSNNELVITIRQLVDLS